MGNVYCVQSEVPVAAEFRAVPAVRVLRVAGFHRCVPFQRSLKESSQLRRCSRRDAGRLGLLRGDDGGEVEAPVVGLHGSITGHLRKRGSGALLGVR